MRRIKYIINHWSAGSVFASVDDIRTMHKAKGWRDIGYHRIILHPHSKQFLKEPDQPELLIKTGRNLNSNLFIEQVEIGAHTFGYNSESVGICTIGMPGVKLHQLQREALLLTNRILCARFNLDPKVAIKGHRDFNNTQCPGQEIYELLEEMNETF